MTTERRTADWPVVQHVCVDAVVRGVAFKGSARTGNQTRCGVCETTFTYEKPAAVASAQSQGPRDHW